MAKNLIKVCLNTCCPLMIARKLNLDIFKGLMILVTEKKKRHGRLQFVLIRSEANFPCPKYILFVFQASPDATICLSSFSINSFLD